MSVEAFKVKVMDNQTDRLLEKIFNKFCGAIHVVELNKVQSNKIKNNKIIKEVQFFYFLLSL